MARLSNQDREQKQRDSKALYIKGFSLQLISEMIGISVDSLRKWYKEEEWEKAKELSSISPSEIEDMIMVNIKAIKEGEKPPYKADDIAKLVASLDRLKDKKRKAVYTMEVFMHFRDWLLEKVANTKTKERELALNKLKEFSSLMEEYTNTLTHD